MDYEKMYKEALERARYIKENTDSVGALDISACFEQIFPELRESDDERTRKEIVLFLREGKHYYCQDSVKRQEWAAWLEKQGEQKTEIEYIYPKFRIGDVIVPIKPNGYYPPVRVLSIEKKTKSYYCESDDHKHYSSIPIRCENEYKLVEKNLAWSEEDNKMLNSVIQRIKELDHYWNKPTDEKMVDWIKSLRPNHWKPSEYDICLLEEIARNIRNDVRPFCSEVSALEDLIKNIKTL